MIKKKSLLFIAGFFLVKMASTSQRHFSICPDSSVGRAED
jgi:hypothetical protein